MVSNLKIMTAITLQKKLIQKISEINNILVLKSIENLIQEEETPRKLSNLQRKLINIGIQEMKERKGIPNEVVFQELESKYGIL